MKPVSILVALALAACGLAASAQTDADAPSKPKPQHVRSGQRVRKPQPPPAKQVDINRASREELMKVPGITREYADKIIAGRPYLSKTFLASHNIVPMGVYVAIHRNVRVVPPLPPLPSK